MMVLPVLQLGFLSPDQVFGSNLGVFFGSAKEQKW